MTKRISIAVICLLFTFATLLFMPSETMVKGEEKCFADKVIYEGTDSVYPESIKVDGSCQDANLGDFVSVVLQYEETFTCNCFDNPNYDKTVVDIHRNHIQDYYTEVNNGIIAEINVQDNHSVYASTFGPYIVYSYESYDKLMESDYYVFEDADSDALKNVYITYETLSCAEATVGSSNAPNYPISTVISDLGISNSNYNGDGVKIGIIENVISPSMSTRPSDFSKIVDFVDTYDQENYWGDYFDTDDTEMQLEYTYRSMHSEGVYDIISNHIAPGADIYIGNYNSLDTYFEVMDELSGEVDIINMSYNVNGNSGSYSIADQYADYIVRATMVVVITSAGNNGGYITQPGCGANVITVAATDKNKCVASISSYQVAASISSRVLKPTIAAPGVNITGVSPYDAYNESCTGTSYSAAIVSGIVALLMDETTSLIGQPGRVASILASSCVKATGQTSVVDDRVGFGIIDYTKIDDKPTSGSTVDILASEELGRFSYFNITVPAMSEVTVVCFIMNNAPYCQSNYSVILPDCSSVRLELIGPFPGSSTILANGSQTGNYCYVTYVNNTSSQVRYRIWMNLTEQYGNVLEKISIAYNTQAVS